jgi:biofilm PGA synthesis N-glycosyltransferase PgaC
MEAAALIVETIFWISLFLLLYVYLIYPALSVLIGAGRVEETFDELPAVSVLVAAHNEAAVIAEKIQNFRNLDYPPEMIELVIADDGSTDGTADVVRPHQDERVRLLTLRQRGGKSAAMNRLFDAARHPLMLFTDANVMMSPGALRRLVDHLANPSVGAVTGEVRLVNSGQEFGAGERLYYWIERRIQGAESRLGSVMGVDGGMYLVRRELFQKLPDDTILDDFTVAMRVMRAGRRVIYECAAKATESGTPSASQEFARRVRIAAGAVQLLKRGNIPRSTQPILWFQFFSHKLLRWGSPLLFVLLLLTNAALLGRGLEFQLFFGLQLFTYSAILLSHWIPLLRSSAIGAVLLYFGISQIAMVGGLIRGILNRQPPQWKKGRRATFANVEAIDPVGQSPTSLL